MRGADTIAELPDIGWTVRIAAILRGLLATTLCLILGGCAYGGPASSSTTMTTPPSAAATNLPVRAEDKDDHFHLVFELPKATWRTTEAINGQATLSLVGTSSMNVSGS